MSFDTDMFKRDVENWQVYHPTVRQAIISEYEDGVVRTIHLFSHRMFIEGLSQYCETWRGGLDSCSDSTISVVIS